MRSFICAVAAIALSAMLTTAAMAADGNVFDFLGGDAAELRDGFETDTPVAVSYEEKGRRGESFLWGDEPVRRMYEALSRMTVGGPDDQIATDSDNVFTFIMADGRRVGFPFNQRYLEKGAARYSVADSETLWDIDFPGYGGYYSAFDVFFDAEISAFASGFYDEPPVSVSFRQDGGAESTVTDPDFVEDVFEALNVEVDSVSDARYFDPGAETESVFTFTMADGRQLPFTLYGDSIAVDTGVPAVGTLYFRLSSTDALWSLRFEGYESVKYDRGLRDKLLPLYGEAVAEAFGLTRGESRFVSVQVLCRREGEADESFDFSESEYRSASDLASDMDEMECGPALGYTPEGRERVSFVFTDNDGKQFGFEFVDNCAAVPQQDGSVLYYPIYHGDVGDELMELVYNERELLEWKHDVDFDGEQKSGTVVALVAALSAAVLGGVLLIRRRRR